MHALHGPTAIDEFRCQPIDQFGMRRLASLGSEIVRVAGDGLAEVMLPDSVDDGARGESVLRVRDPLGDI